MKRAPAPYRGESASELLISGLAPDDLTILAPRDPAAIGAVGIRAAADGTAWIVAPQPGEYQLFHRGGSRRIRARAGSLPRKPGYDHVERINCRAQ
jgi:hypothetical protein